MMTEIELSTIISLTDNEDETDIAIQVWLTFFHKSF